MSRPIRTALVLASFALLVAGRPIAAYADDTSDLTITPVVIDEKGKARDIINESITLTNDSSHLLELYPSVNDVNDETGEQAFQYAQNSAGLSDSLSNWIELSRGVIELGPGEQKVVPFTITINENAVAGTYHAVITFGEGTTRDDAEAEAPLGSVAVNLEVDADIKEAMQLGSFTSDSMVFTGDDVLFNYQLQNIGNQDLQPSGEIDIYDRKGEEVATIDVNKEGKTVSPDQTAQLASVWSAATGFGKFKALLNVKYGTSQTATVQDTVFFWVVPWQQILELFIASLVAVIILGLYFQRWLEGKHLTKLEAAGALKPGVFEQILNTPPPPIVPLPSLASLPSLPELPAIPPVGEIAERVQAQVRHKRTLFTIFKRQGFVSVPEPLAKSINEVAPTPAPAPQAPGGTIDLKQMRKSVPQAPPSDSHIINLKKNP